MTKDLWQKTPGEMFDEVTKRLVRAKKTGVNFADAGAYQVAINSRFDVIRMDDDTYGGLQDAQSDLTKLNDQIWDAIDAVTSFNVYGFHEVGELARCIEVAQMVQALNRQRTDKIREIDRLCGVESTVPEKVHKNV